MRGRTATALECGSWPSVQRMGGGGEAGEPGGGLSPPRAPPPAERRPRSPTQPRWSCATGAGRGGAVEDPPPGAPRSLSCGWGGRGMAQGRRPPSPISQKRKQVVAPLCQSSLAGRTAAPPEVARQGRGEGGGGGGQSSPLRAANAMDDAQRRMGGCKGGGGLWGGAPSPPAQPQPEGMGGAVLDGGVGGAAQRSPPQCLPRRVC